MRHGIANMERAQNNTDRTGIISEILFEDWDPIGFGPLLPVDEYDAYIPGIARLLHTHCAAGLLEAHLGKIEKERFGAAQPSGKARIAAKKLVKSWSKAIEQVFQGHLH